MWFYFARISGHFENLRKIHMLILNTRRRWYLRFFAILWYLRFFAIVKFYKVLRRAYKTEILYVPGSHYYPQLSLISVTSPQVPKLSSFLLYISSRHQKSTDETKHAAWAGKRVGKNKPGKANIDLYCSSKHLPYSLMF